MKPLRHKIRDCLMGLPNLWTPRYKTSWIEDIPEKFSSKKIYVIGGRKYPFQAAFLCPRGCGKKIFLNVSEKHKAHKRWEIEEDQDGRISLSPSIWVKDSDCGCHYWVKRGRIVWCRYWDNWPILQMFKKKLN